MKKIFYLVLAGLIATTSTNAQSFWKGLAGPYGGTINDIISPSAGLMIASTANGVYRSSDSGTTWSRINLGTDNSFSDLETDPSSSGNKIFVASKDGARIHVSTDAGLNWTQLATTGIVSIVTKIKVTPNGTIYLTDTSSRLLKSIDGGTSFTNPFPLA